MSAGHTPGPWDYPGRFNKMTGCWPVNLPSGQIEVRTDNGVQDARLIAAAPELLAALEAALPAVQYYDEHEGAFATLSMVRAAIDKAKGGDS